MIPSTEIDVRSLVTQFDRGHLQLPELQRNFVWNEEKGCRFLDSMYREYPTGNILLWDCGDLDIPTRKTAVERNRRRKVSYKLLLDGQQRITWLTAVLLGKELTKGKRVLQNRILFNIKDPEEQEAEYEDDKDEVQENDRKDWRNVTFMPWTKDLAENKGLIDVRQVLNDEISLLKILKQLGVTADDEISELYEKRISKLQAINKYVFRAYELSSSLSYSKVAQVFVRVNSDGLKLKTSDLALAVISAKWPNSLEIFEQYVEHCKQKLHFEIELSYHLRNLLIFSTKQGNFQEIKRVRSAALKEAWRQSKRSMEKAIGFIKSNVKITEPFLLSSKYLLIVLAYYLYMKKYRINSNERSELKRWVKVANLRARYGSSIDSVLSTDIGELDKKRGPTRLIEVMRSVGKYDQIAIEELVDHKSSSIYVKMMYLTFQRLGATDWNTNKVIAYGQQKSKLQTHHIFPKAYLNRNGITNLSEINDIANLCFIEDETNQELAAKGPGIYIPDKISKNGSDDIFTNQCIPTDEKLLNIKNFPDFIAKRKSMILKEMNKYINES